MSHLIFSSLLMVACTLSNKVEDIKVLCGIKVVNAEIQYIRLLTPGLRPLTDQELATVSAEFIHDRGYRETLTTSPSGCLSIPKTAGQLSVRASSDKEWVAFESGLTAQRSSELRDLPLAERGRLGLEMPCPDQGFLSSEAVTPLLNVKNSEGNLQNLQLTIGVTDKTGLALGTLFTKDFGAKDLTLPSRLALDALTEGEYMVQRGPSDLLGNSGQVTGPQVPVPLSEAALSVAVSSVSSCALLKSGRVQCWGYLPKKLGESGQLNYEVAAYPQWVQLADGSDLMDVESLLVGGGPDHDTYCAVTKGKIGLCWGKDLFSYSGKQQFGSWLYPRRVFSESFVQQLAVSDREICALDTAGAVICQGSGLADDLALITADMVAHPVKIPLPAPARYLSSQQIGKCALLIDDRLYCWGLKTDRSSNQEFNFLHGVPDIPRAMSTAEERPLFFQAVKEMGLNGEISCVLKSDDKPVCQLGSNAYTNDLGNYKVSVRPTLTINPIREIVGPDNQILRGIKTMGVGFWHGCGVNYLGQVYCWGNNQFGRLGNGTIGESGTGTGIPRFIRATLVQAP